MLLLSLNVIVLVIVQVGFYHMLRMAVGCIICYTGTTSAHSGDASPGCVPPVGRAGRSGTAASPGCRRLNPSTHPTVGFFYAPRARNAGLF